MIKELKKQMEVAKKSLKPDAKLLKGFVEMHALLVMFHKYLETTWTKRLEELKKPSKKLPPKSNKNLKVLKKPIRPEIKCVHLDKR